MITQGAILFADVVGSARLFETLGDSEAKKRISQCLDPLSRITLRHAGRVIKTMGDEIMALFPTADDVVLAACEMQEEMEVKGTFGSDPIAIRIGICHGPILLEEGDVFGDTVNLAARMTKIAFGRQIITTESTVKLLSAEIRQNARKYDRAKVKGKEELIIIYEMVWEDEERVTDMEHADFLHVGRMNSLLELRYHGEKVVLDRTTKGLVLGRGEHGGLVVEAPLVSRVHARIEYRRGKFILQDRSTNGTFVRTQDGEVVYLRREEIPLWGAGSISLGRSTERESEELIAFRCW